MLCQKTILSEKKLYKKIVCCISCSWGHTMIRRSRPFHTHASRWKPESLDNQEGPTHAHCCIVVRFIPFNRRFVLCNWRLKIKPSIFLCTTSKWATFNVFFLANLRWHSKIQFGLSTFSFLCDAKYASDFLRDACQVFFVSCNTWNITWRENRITNGIKRMNE